MGEKPTSEDEIEITPDMIKAGMTAYNCWEPDHVFDDFGGAASYAKRDLVRKIFMAMLGASDLERLDSQHPKFR